MILRLKTYHMEKIAFFTNLINVLKKIKEDHIILFEDHYQKVNNEFVSNLMVKLSH